MNLTSTSTSVKWAKWRSSPSRADRDEKGLRVITLVTPQGPGGRLPWEAPAPEPGLAPFPPASVGEVSSQKI